MYFNAEEFLDLWTNLRSECIDIGLQAPTAYDIVKSIKSQDPKDLTVEDVIDFFKKNFMTDKNWEQLMKKHWDKVKLFT